MNTIQDIIARVIDRFDQLSDTQKKVLSAIGLVLISIVIGIVIYLLFFRSFFPSTTVVNTNNTVNTGGQLPDVVNNNNRNVVNGNEATLPTVDTTAQGGNTIAQVIFDGNAQDAVLGSDGKTVQYYDPTTGQFYRIDANGNAVALSSKTFKGVEQATWSHGGDKAVLELNDGYNILYDFTSEKQYTLHEDMAEFDFAPTDDQITFKFNADRPEDRWLGVANLDGSGALGIERLGENGDQVDVAWSPSGQAIGTYEEFISADTKRIIPIGLKGENFEDIKVEGRDFQFKWSPSGKQMLYSTYTAANNYNPSISIVEAYGDNIGKNQKSLQLNTSIDKCTFTTSGDAIYCAVPVDPPTGGGISPDILNTVQHDLYKINLSTGTSTKIATPVDDQGKALTFAPTEVIVTENEDVLYYKEADTGRLRRVLL